MRVDEAILYMTLYRQKLVGSVSDLDKDIEAYDMAIKALKQELKKCKDCKWWKDSDGVFRRGIEAESQCPMNRIEVFEGNGYCYMFEPQESEEMNGKNEF